jgi:hypothetical protein
MRRVAIPHFFLFAATILAAAFLLVPAKPRAQMKTPLQNSGQEFVANLATGRVIVCVAKDGMLVGAISEKTEVGSHPPLFIPLVGGHVAVMLGAVEWIALNSGKPPVRLDTELAAVSGVSTHTVANLDPNEAGDLEGLGMAFLERLRPVTGQLHHELGLKPDEPIIQIVLAGYQKDYGPEVWVLSYHLQQRQLRDDYWDTLAQRPSYVQLYPPEKGAPRTLVEFRYPPEIKGSTLQELLGQNDSRLISIRSTDPKAGAAAQLILDGSSQKSNSEGATTFLRGAMTATAPPGANLTLAILHEGDRFDWIIPPVDVPVKPDEKRDPTAPTLRAPHH